MEGGRIFRERERERESRYRKREERKEYRSGLAMSRQSVSTFPHAVSLVRPPSRTSGGGLAKIQRSEQPTDGRTEKELGERASERVGRRASAEE